jgi:thioredoxin 1
MEATMELIPLINSKNFDHEVLQATLPVLVEFGAEWCAPCKQLEPELSKLADEYSGKVRILKIDVDEASDLTARLQVMSVPTVILFVNGKATERSTGYLPKNRLVAKFLKG